MSEKSIVLDKWDERFLRLAKEVSTWSKDPGTKVGSVLVSGKALTSVGYNGFPSSIEDKQELLDDRISKLQRTIHAEVNTILSADSSTLESFAHSLYVYPFMPCAECAKLILAKPTIYRVVCPYTDVSKHVTWGNSFKTTRALFEEAGVELIESVGGM